MMEPMPLLDEANERAARAVATLDAALNDDALSADLATAVVDVRWLNAELAAEVRRLRVIIDPPPVMVDLGPLTLAEVAQVRAEATLWQDAPDTSPERDVWRGLLAKVEAATA